MVVDVQFQQMLKHFHGRLFPNGQGDFSGFFLLLGIIKHHNGAETAIGQEINHAEVGLHGGQGINTVFESQRTKDKTTLGKKQIDIVLKDFGANRGFH